MNISETVFNEIKNGWKYDVLFGNELANHLPMVVFALSRMGASVSDIKSFSTFYTVKLEPMRGGSGQKILNINECLGKRECFAGFVSFFEEELDVRGIEAVLRTYVDLLFPGIAASAFHALIRLAYAIEIGSKKEIAISLAFWSSEYQYSGTIYPSIKRSPYEILNKFKVALNGFDPGPGNITNKINAISNHPDFRCKELQPEDINISLIALIAIKLYLTSGDFILLHGVTATHALRIILPFSKSKNAALRYFWIALTAAVIASESDKITENRLDDIGKKTDFKISKFKQSTFISKDDHTIKFIYSCWQEFKEYGCYEYIEAMERRLT